MPGVRVKSDTYFLNALRNLLGFCPLPFTPEAELEKLNRKTEAHHIGWYNAEGDGCRRIPKQKRAE